MPPREVFLSHSSQDRETAERIARVLCEHGVPVYYTLSNLVGAQQWQEEILKALKRCDWFMVLITPDAIESMWVKREIAIALDEKRFENRIIPLIYRACDRGQLGWLRTIQFVDFQNDFRQGCAELLRIWGIGLRE